MAAVIGRPDDGSALYHNPAGLVLEDGWHVYLSAGLFLVRSQFELAPWAESDRFLGITPEATGYYAPTKPARSMGAAPMLAVTGAILPGKLWVGAGVFVGNAQGAAFDAKAVTRYHLIDGYIIAPQAVVAAAYKINGALSVGATAGVLNMRIHGKREVYPILNGMDASKTIGTHALLELDGSAWAPTWMVGAYGRPHPRVTYGATITGRIDADLEGPVKITYSDDAFTPNDVLLGSQKTHQLLPWSFMGGVNVDVTPHLEIGSEFRYWLYRQYQKQHTDLKGIVFLRELETIKNYRDSWEISGGARVHDLPAAPGLELMLGTHFDRTPAPEGGTTLTLDQPTFNHIGLHSGARYAFGRYRVGASYLHYWYDIPVVTTSITNPPTNFRGDGGNHVFTLSFEAQL
ncbi:MAG: outer membrane protein transport protein, partial [Proteobacteria bacterium]|nr:outer membrane protein transport protein [Pseudomonadota bacterium]